MSIDPNLSFDAYLAHPGASSSTLRAIRTKCPGAALWERTHPRAETDATRLGTAAHCYILTPDIFMARYVCKPDGLSFATKEGKAWRDAHKGMEILSFEEYSKAVGIHGSFWNHPLLSRLPALGREVSMFWKGEGVECKGRPDLYDDDWVYDIKVTRHATPAKLAYAAYTNGWMHQLAWYRWGLEENGVRVKGGRLIAIDPEAPHPIVLAEARDSALDICALENHKALRTYAECVRTGEWPWYSDSEWMKLDVPGYALDQVKIDEFNEEV